MADQIPFGSEAVSFASNPEPRVACVVLVDTSYSMDGRPIEEVAAGLSVLKSELQADELSTKRAEVAIVTFGGGVTVAHDFSTVDLFTPPSLTANGDTPMGAAISQAIDLVTARKKVYRDNGIAYYRPWIFLITDGAPTDHWNDAAIRVQEGEKQGEYVFFSVGVDGADFTVLKSLSRLREPLKLKGLRFRDLFQWLSKSLRSVSHSKMNASAPIENPVGPTGWAEVPTGN